jgi:hypothetical protein
MRRSRGISRLGRILILKRTERRREDRNGDERI